MSTYNADRIRKPKYFRLAPLRSGRPKLRTPYVIGFDSEAEAGRPFLLQFGLPTGQVILIDPDYRDPEDALRQFLTFLHQTCTRKDAEYLVFGFNLQYEYTQLFRAIPDAAKNDPEFELDITVHEAGTAFRIRALNDKRYTFTVEIGGTHRRVKVLDAMAYFPMSLDAASKVINIGAKLTKPKRFVREHRHEPEFIAYAEQDARLTQLLGEYIMQLHETYDVATCMSSPHFAARTYRRRFLNDTIPRIDPDLEQIGLDAYHGGKNGYYLEGPRLLRDVYSYDIRSAYPEAMRALPDPVLATWHAVNVYTPGTHAIYRVELAYKGCTYDPVLYHDNSIADPGVVVTTVTGYELDAMLAEGDIERATVLAGWEMRGPSGGSLSDYVDTFYAMKANAKTPAERNAAKLFLNSLYGKFFQKQGLGIVGSYDFETGVYVATDPEQEYDYEAGGLYHPPIAALITGFVRAKIHRLEHKYAAVMTSTDGIFAYREPDPADTHSGLGGLDVSRGTLRIWRERLYLFAPTDGSKPKEARHGFRGTVEQLRAIPLKAGTFGYHTTAMMTLRMSTRTYHGTRYAPGQFADLPFDIVIKKSPKTLDKSPP